VAIGVTCAGERDILGLWAGDGGEGYGTSTGSFPPICAAA
jgi:transposase-like protein